MSKHRKSSVLIIGAGPIVAAMLCAACAREPEIAPLPETRAERLAVIERLATECRVPRVMMELVGQDRLQLRPSPALAYDRVECVLRRIDELNLPAGNVDFGGNFVGNEAPAPEANNAKAH